MLTNVPDPGAVLAAFNRDSAQERVAEAIEILTGDPERHEVELRSLRAASLHLDAARAKAVTKPICPGERAAINRALED